MPLLRTFQVSYTKIYDTAYKTFLEEVLAQYPDLKPVAIAAFGGRVPQELLPKLANERVLGRLPEFQEDNRDWDRIEQWAHLVGKIFSE